ncbi:unnamed protein product [Penicillium nalgiovense]|nr:unnamed protein product [Penicillium nalgiovense]
MRFDIFKGPFTQDSAFIVSPFTSTFRYVKDVPYDKAQLVVDVLNKQPQVLSTDEYPLTTLAPPEQLAYPEDVIAQKWSPASEQIPISGPDLVPGYTTKDDAGTDGDDTIHSPITFYRVPNCIRTLIPANTSETPKTVDLVYLDFIEKNVILAAKFAGLDLDIAKESDAYMPGMTLTNLILDWVKKNWEC